jgi:hypothetical protein
LTLGLLNPCLIHSIEVEVVEVFVTRTMKAVRATLHGRVELTARRVSELGIELAAKKTPVRQTGGQV